MQKIEIEVEISITKDNVILFDNEIFNINIFMEFVHKIDPDITYEWININDDSDNFNLLYKGSVLEWNDESATKGLRIGYFTKFNWDNIEDFCEFFQNIINLIKKWYTDSKTSTKTKNCTFTI